ncbi:MAG TPA: hypothetical protein VLK22_03140 [Candidatus Udaeobacter sp.]|nr:hypothetical protein [Candidatus Udaeobacter sp.]
MKKFLIILAVSFGVLLSPAANIYAQTDLSQDIAKKSGYSTTAVGSNTFSETVGKFIKVILGTLGVVFLALTVYAGALWMTAGGNEENIEKAMGILKTAVIGLIIILSAYSITYFVLSKSFELTS